MEKLEKRIRKDLQGVALITEPVREWCVGYCLGLVEEHLREIEKRQELLDLLHQHVLSGASLERLVKKLKKSGQKMND